MKRIALVTLVTAGFACNMITGADKLGISDDDDEATTASGLVGSGGATTGAASGGATSSSNTQQAATGTTTVAASSTGSGVDPCTYPAGPYGVAQGQVVPPNLTWQGYAPGSNTVTTISIQDFFDCDGSKGINAVMIDTSQYG